MKELTLCPRCRRPLVGQEEVHAVRGVLYCSRECAIQDITEDYIMNAKAMAIEDYDSEGEVVATHEVLKAELQQVRVTLTITKVINLPADLTEADAVGEACSLVNRGLVTLDVDDCDDSSFTYELVKKNNSKYEDV